MLLDLYEAQQKALEERRQIADTAINKQRRITDIVVSDGFVKAISQNVESELKLSKTAPYVYTHQEEGKIR